MGKFFGSAIDIPVVAANPPIPSAGMLRLFAKDPGSGVPRLYIRNPGSGLVVDLMPAVPVGTIVMFATGSPPTNWLVCDGSTIPTSTPNYTDLVTVLGSGTVPDLRGLFPIGVDASHTLGTTGGALTKSLVEANTPTHVHNIAHTHTMTGRRNVTAGGTQNNFMEASGTNATDDVNTSAVSVTASGNGSGTGAAFDITPPYRALFFIIYAGKSYPP